jgi:hypothetical protein
MVAAGLQHNLLGVATMEAADHMHLASYTFPTSLYCNTAKTIADLTAERIQGISV